MYKQVRPNPRFAPAVKDTAESFFYGLYGTYPILSKSEKVKILKKKQTIEDRVYALADSIKSINEKIKHINMTDTVIIRQHMIFLGGAFTIPALTDAERQKKKKLEPLKKQLQLFKRDKEDFSAELREINNLIKKDKKYLEKKILWGFIIWEIEKND